MDGWVGGWIGRWMGWMDGLVCLFVEFNWQTDELNGWVSE